MRTSNDRAWYAMQCGSLASGLEIDRYSHLRASLVREAEAINEKRRIRAERQTGAFDCYAYPTQKVHQTGANFRIRNEGWKSSLTRKRAILIFPHTGIKP